jgi:ComF family protein
VEDACQDVETQRPCRALAKRWRGLMRAVGHAVTEAVFPRKCMACGAFWSTEGPSPSGDFQVPAVTMPERRLAALFHRVAQPYLCPACRAAFEPVASPVCSQCGVTFLSRVGENHLCGMCIRHPLALGRARSAGVYNGALMALIHRLKYRANLALIAPFSGLLQEAFDTHWQAGEVDMVLPIPLHERRLRQRGFNQAQLLVDAWAAMEPRPNSGGLRFVNARRILVRTRSTPPLTGLGKSARRRSIRGVFKVVDPSAIAGRRILLVDDVFTTGATADEAARTLKRSGAQRVDVITVARTVPHLRSSGATPGHG